MEWWREECRRSTFPQCPREKEQNIRPSFGPSGADRLRQRLGDAGELTAFGGNLTRPPPDNWSSQRHWHSHEDEFVYILEGNVVLIEDGEETLLTPGDRAAFRRKAATVIT